MVALQVCLLAVLLCAGLLEALNVTLIRGACALSWGLAACMRIVCACSSSV